METIFDYGKTTEKYFLLDSQPTNSLEKLANRLHLQSNPSNPIRLCDELSYFLRRKGHKMLRIELIFGFTSSPNDQIQFERGRDSTGNTIISEYVTPEIL